MGPYMAWTVVFLALCAAPVIILHPYLLIFFMAFLSLVRLVVGS